MFGLLPTFRTGAAGALGPVANVRLLSVAGSRLGRHMSVLSLGASSGIFDETWTGAGGAALPASWINQSGTPTQDGANHMIFAAAGQTTRSVGVTNATLTFKVRPDNHYPYMIFRSNSAGTAYSQLVVRGFDGLLVFQEWDGTTATNVVAGTTPIDLSGAATEHTIVVTLSGTGVTIKLDGSTEITATQAINLSNTYLGIGWAGTPFSSAYYFGEVKAA